MAVIPCIISASGPSKTLTTRSRPLAREPSSVSPLGMKERSDGSITYVFVHAMIVGRAILIGVWRWQMCIHTSQHLLSAVLENKLDIPTLAWATAAYPAPSYVEIPRGLSPEEIAFVQEEANKLVLEGRSVHVEAEEFDPKVHVYTGTSVGIPQDYTGGVRRVVVIDGIDRNACVDLLTNAALSVYSL